MPEHGADQRGYRCRVLPRGTGSAAACLGPMLSAWGSQRGLAIVPGTLNVAAERAVALPSVFVSLADIAHLARPPWRHATIGFSPRLYPVWLADVPAWLYRWSGPEHLAAFVGDVDGCPATHRCEVIAEVVLRDHLRLAEGDEVAMMFRAPPS